MGSRSTSVKCSGNWVMMNSEDCSELLVIDWMLLTNFSVLIFYHLSILVHTETIACCCPRYFVFVRVPSILQFISTVMWGTRLQSIILPVGVAFCVILDCSLSWQLDSCRLLPPFLLFYQP